jgi:serine/threonine protein kinase/tetratricopeptide (TPR) repeat protein
VGDWEDDNDDGEERGFVVDRFEAVRRVGAGGMGLVFEAIDRETNAHVALKSLRTLSGDAVLRFKDEFRALSDVRHPNLVRLGELFQEGGQWFFTMELVEGTHFLAHVRPGDYKNGKRVAKEAVSVSDAVTLDKVEGASAAAPAAPPHRGLGFDEVRLRAALKQLALGLSALHAADRLHCDIKPSNVLVTKTGRVVILDFGLVVDTSRNEGPDHVAGTISYMAPEQAGMKPLGPESDWYAVGVVLYQALTGQLPLVGKGQELLARKQVVEPPPPGSVVSGLPEDLASLCVELLRIDPTKRPSGAEILRRLDVEAPTSMPTSLGRGSTFIGRRDELATLRRALADTRERGAVSMFLYGESGVGKSALTRRFTDMVAADVADALLLAGRCHERESVPYKAVDGVVDALVRYFSKHAGAEARLIPPTERGLLGQVFPVMRRIEAVARAPRPTLSEVDPQVLRRRVFGAFRSLLAKLAERHPLVLVVDDLQWADADSLALLAELIRAPGAPHLLFVGTVRTGSFEGRAFRAIEQLAAGTSGDTRVIELGPLPAAEAHALATTLLHSKGIEGGAAARIAAEAKGHPLFIDELVRRAIGGRDGGAMRLDQAIWARIGELDGPERELTKVIALAGAPLRQETVAAALDMAFPTVEHHLATLRSANLVRTQGTRRTDRVEPYHDRVREAVVAQLAEPERRFLHGRIALALEASNDVDPEALAMHWRGAGDPARATREAERAARESMEKLAFDRAARLFQLALELSPRTGAAAVAIHVELAEALANAGRSKHAAEVLLRTAAWAQGGEALELRRRAAEQFLRGGHIDEAMEAFGSVLDAIGMDMPKTTRSALASLVVRRAQVRLRGLGYKARKEAEVPPDLLARIDMSWMVASGLALVDTVRGAYFQSRTLLLALDAGEEKRIARALAVEAGYSSASGGHTQARTAELVKLARSLAERTQDPYSIGWATGAEGVTAALEGRWDVGHTASEKAESIFQEHCRGVAWEIASMRWFSLWSQCYLGRLAELSVRVPERFTDAESRGDLYAAMCHASGLANMVWLVEDDPAEARRRLDTAMSRWSQRNFHVEHWWELLARGQLELYEGDGAGALAHIQERWGALDGSMLLRVQLTLLEAVQLRARASLLAATQSKDPRETKALLAATERDIATIDKENMPWSNPLAELLRAGIASAKGDAAAARTLLARAVPGLEAAHLGLYAMAARNRLGEALVGEEGQAQRDTAETWFALQGVANAERLTGMLAPGFRK